MDKEMVIYNRLSEVAYSALEKKVRVVGSVPKTELEAGFACGVEFVMRAIREGFAVTPE